MLLLAASCVLGLIVGSFLNVVIHRVPRGTFLSGGRRSHCPSCGHSIAWFDNVPVVSWLVLRGRARCCGAAISWRYPLVELLTGLAFLWIASGRSGQLFAGGSLDGTVAALLGLDFYLVATLIAASAIDLEHRILPDVINFIGIGAGIAAALFVPELHAGCWLGGQVRGIGAGGLGLLNAVLGAAAGAGSLYSIALVGRLVYRTEAMGLGDVKFMAFTGTFIGPDGVLLALLIACLSGAVIGLLATIKTGDPLIPFGPFLALGVLVAHFAAEATARVIFKDWPRWLAESPYGLPVVLAVTIASFAILLYLRRRRRNGPGGAGGEESPHDATAP